MDHLIIPPGTTHIRVPYKCTEFYDGGDFFDYPARKGWTREELLGEENISGRTNAEIESFFQTWLYFGTLISLFKLHGVDIDTLEFLKTDEATGQIFVTTQEVLPRKIREWREKYQNLGKRDRNSMEAKKTFMILSELWEYITRNYGAEYEVNSVRLASTAASWPVADEITLSMIALGHILEMARRDILKNRRPRTRWRAGPLLKERLLGCGWCPLDVERFLGDVEIDGQYYLSLKKYPYDKERHRGCDESSCRASTVDESVYVTQHVSPGCTCAHVVTTEGIVPVVENGGIPVLSWSKGAEVEGTRFVVDDANANAVAYVAISHVWADGLGNPNENSLPKCQLEVIQSRVDALFPNAESHPIHFWMDTLCIPVKDDTLKKKSIQMMRQIYRRASAVLVLDAGLLQVEHSDTLSEKALAVYMSNWLHRLWTFQEGMLAQKLCFQLKDGPMFGADFDNESVKEKETNEEQGLYGSFQFDARTAALGHFTILRDYVQEKLGLHGYRTYFPPLAHAIHQRTTTRISDEAICAATIIDIKLDDILAVPTKDKDGKIIPYEIVAEERMEIFMTHVGDFVTAIIFHHQKHLRKEGYRWAPRTLMGASRQDFSRGINGESSRFTGEGLQVRFSGLILDTIAPGSGKEITVTMKHDKSRYRLLLFPDDEEGASPVWEPVATYAVIMHQSISARSKIGTDALVVTLKNSTAVHSERAKPCCGFTLDMVIKVRFEWRAWLEPLDLAQTGLSTDSMAELLGEQQAWRVF